MTPSPLDRGRVALYVGGGIAGAALAASALLLSRDTGAVAAFGASIVPSLLLGILGLAARYPCRVIALRRSSATRIVATHAVSAAAASALWIVVWEALPGLAGRIDLSLLFGLGMLLYLMAVAFHYLLIEVDTAREAEQAALRYELLAREAELRAFKAQVDPHFLYNSLNAVASLCGSRPHDAREMSQLLADFFRQSLRLGGREQITLAEEIDLVSRYLSIEKIRFGERLAVAVEVDDAARETPVPPLILQPLVENAVRHGISSVLDGGTVRVKAAVQGDAVRISVTNPADPDRAHAAGEGIGIANVRGRLNALFGARASMNAEEAGGEYRVQVEVPR